VRVDVVRVVKCHKGLSIAVMTLILLVISILLALIATLYALNVTNRLPEEALRVHKHHIWYNSSGDWYEAGFVVTNIGGRDVVLNKITVRSNMCAWSSIYYWKTNTVTVSDDPSVTSGQLSGTSYNITVQGELRNFTRASDKLTLKSGWTIVLYIRNPIFTWGNGEATLMVNTANAPHGVSCNLESAE
jgi:hypothetical protein